MSVMLRPYQNAVVDEIMCGWFQQNHKDMCGVMPTGAGKSFTLAHIVAEFSKSGKRVIVKAHRQELVGQLSCALATMGIVHTFVAAASTIRYITNLHVEKFGRSFYSTTASVCVASAQTLVRRDVANWASGVSLQIDDECFVAGTLIDGVPIETIKVGDYVTAFNESTGGFKKQRVMRLFKNPAPKVLYEITGGMFHPIKCTGGHPFWTKRGWVNAADLTTNDNVMVWGHWQELFNIISLSNAHAVDGYVYNIEVEHDHTYIANGVVVHNCHHVLRDNLWGKCHAKFPNAYGLGVTATPARADGKGLGRHADGVYDHMVLGPTMRELINMGNLCDYKIFVPPTDLDLSGVKTSQSTGEYQKDSLNVAVEKSHIVGDVIENYMRICPGKLGITFTTSVEKSVEIASNFTAAGIPAGSLSAKNTDAERSDAIRDFSNGKIRQLVNVGLFDEGFDVPGLEVVCDAQPTKSLPKFHQKFGRGLRTKEGKTHALYIDFAQNIRYSLPDGRNVGNHYLPDTPQSWSLDRRESRGKTEVDPNEEKMTRCTGVGCFQVYPAHLPACIWCGHVPLKSVRTGPEYTDGDLFELPADMLAQMRGEIDRIDMDPAAAADAYHMPNGMARAGFMKNHRLRAEAQVSLRAHISQWSGVMRNCVGFDDRSIYKAFYKQYGVDVLKAQTLGRPEAEALTARIAEILEINGISV